MLSRVSKSDQIYLPFHGTTFLVLPLEYIQPKVAMLISRPSRAVQAPRACRPLSRLCLTFLFDILCPADMDVHVMLTLFCFKCRTLPTRRAACLQLHAPRPSRAPSPSENVRNRLLCRPSNGSSRPGPSRPTLSRETRVPM